MGGSRWLSKQDKENREDRISSFTAAARLSASKRKFAAGKATDGKMPFGVKLSGKACEFLGSTRKMPLVFKSFSSGSMLIDS